MKFMIPFLLLLILSCSELNNNLGFYAENSNKIIQINQEKNKYYLNSYTSNFDIINKQEINKLIKNKFKINNNSFEILNNKKIIYNGKELFYLGNNLNKSKINYNIFKYSLNTLGNYFVTEINVIKKRDKTLEGEISENEELQINKKLKYTIEIVDNFFILYQFDVRKEFNKKKWVIKKLPKFDNNTEFRTSGTDGFSNYKIKDNKIYIMEYAIDGSIIELVIEK